MPQVDYAALADQARNSSPPPPPAAGPVDYAALADQARGGHADFSATNEPPSTALKAAAYGKDALQLALDALPGAGAVVGGVLATPETGGAGTLTGAALGAGAGRGLRDLIAAGIGLQKPTTATAEGGKIAMDVGETALAGKILPALWAAIKTPGATVADVYEGVRGINNTFPKLLRWNLPKLPPGVGKAPAAVLQRSASQTWEDFLDSTKQPTSPLARTTGTAWDVTAPSTVAPASPGASVPAAPAPPAVPASPQSGPRPPSGLTPTPESAALAASLPDQKALNEAALAARRTAYQASQSASSAATGLTKAEEKAFMDLVKRGMPGPDALKNILLQRTLAGRLGTPSTAEVTASVAKRNITGRWE